jgi:hypothetical protein
MIDVSISFDEENISNDEAEKLEDILRLVVEEYVSASIRFGKFASPHEGIAIVQEEFEELKNAVFWPHKSDSDSSEEATQLTAMGLRFLVDVVYG